VKIAPRIKRQLLTALKGYAELKAQRDMIDSRMDAHKAEVGDIREALGEEKLEIEGFKIAHVQGTQKKLNHQTLISLGCAAAWITEATEEHPKKAYEKITCPGEKGHYDE
jgi:hypothetical protein